MNEIRKLLDEELKIVFDCFKCSINFSSNLDHLNHLVHKGCLLKVATLKIDFDNEL